MIICVVLVLFCMGPQRFQPKLWPLLVPILRWKVGPSGGPWGVYHQQNVGIVQLDGGFKDFLFSPLLGEDSHVDEYFSKGLKPPTRQRLISVRSRPPMHYAKHPVVLLRKVLWHEKGVVFQYLTALLLMDEIQPGTYCHVQPGQNQN